MSSLHKIIFCGKYIYIIYNLSRDTNNVIYKILYNDILIDLLF